MQDGSQSEYRSKGTSKVLERTWSQVEAVDERILTTLRRISLPLLRISLGVVFVWFGGLKIANVTPVAELVADTVYWVDPSWFVPLLGVFEVAVGVGLLLGRALRVVLALFAAQMIGTFLVLVVQPDVAFQRGNLLLLTTEGEFVIKNLVLLSAGLVIGSSLRKVRPLGNLSQDAPTNTDAREASQGAVDTR
jgi:putative oxidoreductase